MDFFAFTFIFYFMFFSVVSSTPACSMNDFSMCVPNSECKRCDGECLCIDPPPSPTTCNNCLLPATCVNLKCVDPKPNDGDGTRYPTDVEVTTLQRYAHYSFVAYEPKSSVIAWNCKHCNQIPGANHIKFVSELFFEIVFKVMLRIHYYEFENI
jgi:hypothetical protein